jgi:hypothetical protein
MTSQTHNSLPAFVRFIGKISASQALLFCASVFLAGSGHAQQACSQISNPTPGTKCLQQLRVETNHVEYGRSDRATPATYTPPSGWYFLAYEGPIATSRNNGSATVELVTRGADFRILNSAQDYERQLNDLDSQNKSYVQVKGIGYGGQSRVIEKARWENQQRMRAFSSAQTNIDRIQLHAKAAGRCTKKVLGVCVDNAGGWYRGYINITLVYVGTYEQLESEKRQTINQIRLGLTENQLPPVQTPSSNSYGREQAVNACMQSAINEARQYGGTLNQNTLFNRCNCAYDQVRSNIPIQQAAMFCRNAYP